MEKKTGRSEIKGGEKLHGLGGTPKGQGHSKKKGR